MKIAIVLGTRPEIIKMASIIDEIYQRSHDLILIHTGQHYDHEMSDQFFHDLELSSPNYNIAVGSGSHGIQTGRMIERIEEILLVEKPDILLVQGDTNAVLAGAIVAAKLHIPVGHVEAGLRSFDDTMPEEINRKVADICSKLYFVPTSKSAINLSLEGISRKDIFITGNTIVDACFRNLEIAKKRNNSQYQQNSKIKNNSKYEKILGLDNIMTLTMHRAENVDNKERLSNIIDALSQLNDFNIIFPIHPRTKKTLKDFDLYDKLNELNHIYLIKPVGYLDFLLLLSKSKLILTDSGGLQEEAITLNIPVLTLRYNTERPETIAAGGNILVGSKIEKIVETAKNILYDTKYANKMKSAINPYGNGNSGKQIVDIIENKYNNDLLSMNAPENIMNDFKSQISLIKEDIMVVDFENMNNAKIRIVFKDDLSNESMEFPTDNLNLKNKFILFDIYAK